MITFRRAGFAVAGLAAAAVVVTVPATGAVPSDGTHRPPGANVGVWDKYWTEYRQADDWAPQGRVLTDAGFRAYPDGFSFFNYGVPDSSNNEMFGTPVSGPPNLDAATLRDLLGPRVCANRAKSGPCPLTLTAKRWLTAVNAGMAGGHCFGIATTVQLLFQRELRPQAFQAGATSTYDLALQAPLSRAVARQMAAQWAMELDDHKVAPRKVPAALQQALVQGRTPYVLAFFFPGGGHAVTPYAVHDRGNGQYDIALYDNNYPDAARAMRIDTVADEATYQVSTDPRSRKETEVRRVLLIPVTDIAKVQTCPFCPGESEMHVALEPVKSDVPLGSRITTPSGKPLRGVEVKRPTNPWEPGEPWAFPTYTVPKNEPFVVTIDARRSDVPIRTDLLATSGGKGYTLGAVNARIPAGGIGKLGVDPRQGVVLYRSGDRRLGRLEYVQRLPDSTETAITTNATAKGARVVGGEIDLDDRQVTAFPLNGRPGRVQARATHQYVKKGRVQVLMAKVDRRLPRGAQLVLDYDRWSQERPRALRAVLVKADRDRRKVRVHFGE